MNTVLFNIQHFSIHDGPGIRTVLFFKGCPLHCKWCHNPESQPMQKTLSFLKARCTGCGSCLLTCSKNAHLLSYEKHTVLYQSCIGCGQCVDACSYGALELFGREYTLDEILRQVGKDNAYYDNGGGITVSGGEPFAQFPALMTLLQALKKSGYHVAIETSGFTSNDRLRQAADYTDLFLYDLKCYNSETHKSYTGVDNQRILENLQWLLTNEKNVWVRIPIIPTVNDSEEEMLAIRRFLDANGFPEKVELLPYHTTGEYKYEALGKKLYAFAPPTEAKMAQLRNIFS